MDTTSVEKVAEAVLYEGYLLFPYRRSAVKNQQRWTFGGVYPRRYSEANGGHDPWLMQTQCLVSGDADTRLRITVRFLHVADRFVASWAAPGETSDAVAGRPDPPDGMSYVEALRVGERVHRPWEEAIERDVPVGNGPLRLGDLLERPRTVAIDVPAGRADEALCDATGHTDKALCDAAGRMDEALCDAMGREVGALVRVWRPLQGTIEVAAESLDLDASDDPATEGSACYRVTVRVTNTTPCPGQGSTGQGRGEAVRQTLVSTHTILRAEGGAFISLLEPPPAFADAAAGCANIKTWPVLVGDDGARHTVLSSPIILYDYPRVSPESPGNLFDATEIDELLTLSIMALSDDEKQEMRESDARGREILERTESLPDEHVMKLHGAVRPLQPSREEKR